MYGTGAAVPALVAAGVPAHGPVIRRAVRWLEEHQNPDGGWGEDIRSYTDPRWIGRGTSTASQTAWALLALLAAGERDRRRPSAGSTGWSGTQRADGSWDEPQFTGTGFPGDFSINYHLYRLVFPLSALGRYAEATAVTIVAALRLEALAVGGTRIGDAGAGRPLPDGQAGARRGRRRGRPPASVLATSWSPTGSSSTGRRTAMLPSSCPGRPTWPRRCGSPG